jgi:nucleoid-associated protein YgaU
MSPQSRSKMPNTDLCPSRKMHVHTPVALRTPLRCGLSILVCSCLLFGAQQCRAHAQQDVAEAARQERARKEQAKKSRHVYTDEDLKRDKILTPDDEARMAADRKQPSPVDPATEDLLGANAELGQLPLGDIARRYRNAKRAMQAPEFHLPFDEPILAEPIFAAPSFAAPAAPIRESVEHVGPAASELNVMTARPVIAPARPHLAPAQPKAAAAPAINQPALRRVDPFAKRLTPAAPVTVAPIPAGPVHRAIPAPLAPTAVPSALNAAPAAPPLERPRPNFTPSASLATPAPIKPHVVISAPPAPNATAAAPSVAPAAPRINGDGPSFASPSAPMAAPVKPRITISAPPAPLVTPPVPKPAPAAPRFSMLRPTFTSPIASEIAPAKTAGAPRLAIAAPSVPTIRPSAPKGAPAAPRFSVFRRTFTPPTASEIAPVPLESSTAAAVVRAHTVTVQSGDSLWSLALGHLGRGSRWRELLAANPTVTDPNRIAAGTQLVVPEQPSALTLDTKVSVRDGDTLSKIARAQYHRAANWRCIAAANPQIQDPNRIFAGQELLLPANCQK